MGFFSRAFLVFLMKESKKKRRKQPDKLMAKSRSQPVNLPGARPLMNPLVMCVCLGNPLARVTLSPCIQAFNYIVDVHCIMRHKNPMVYSVK